MTAAAVKATFADWKLIKTRGVIQLVFEVPLHEADLAYQVVGGMPDAAAERWFAIARLVEVRSGSTDAPETQGKQATSVESRDQGAVDPSRPTLRKSWDELTPAQQAGILCNDPGFQLYLQEKFCGLWGQTRGLNAERATQCVYSFCQVDSRSAIRTGSAAELLWESVVQKYRTWQLAAKVVPA